MGIADLGGPGGGEPSNFRTDDLRGSIGLGPVTAYNASLPSDADGASFQLNAFVVFDWHDTRYAYWVQDVAGFNTSTREVNFEDNVWNVTSVALASSAIQGNGIVSGTGSNSYYGFAAPCTDLGACVLLPDPTSLTLELVAHNGSGGVPAVQFEYNDQGAVRTYDTVSFPFATSTSGFQGFYVDPGLGVPGGCPRCFGDVELVAGGPGNGYQTTLSGATDVTMALDWWNGYNLQPVPDATDYGEATEEGLSGGVVREIAGPTGEPEAELTDGLPAPLGTLWSDGSMPMVEATAVGAADGTLDTGFGNLSFNGSEVVTLLVPGEYSFTLTANATSYPLGTQTLVRGQVLTLEAGGVPLVFDPVGLPDLTIWTVQVGELSLPGTGNITFGELPGAYNYYVDSVPGYVAAPRSGNATVGGTGAVVTIDWSPGGHSILSEAWALFRALLPVIVLLAVTGVVVGAATSFARRRARRRAWGTVRGGAPRRAAPELPCPHCGAPFAATGLVCPRCGSRRPTGGPPPRSS